MPVQSICNEVHHKKEGQTATICLNYARISAVIFHDLILTSALGKKLPHLKSVPKSKYESPGVALPLSANTMLGGKITDKDQGKCYF